MPSLTSPAAWPVEPPLFLVVAAAALYWLGGRRRVSARRGELGSRARAACFYLGLAVVAGALDSPLDPLAERLFAAHMLQHVLLLSVAPVLVLLGAPWGRVWQPLPLGLRRRTARAVAHGRGARPLRAAAGGVSRPAVAWLLFNADLVAWHVPALYDATLRSPAAHDLEHALFFCTALVFWGCVLDSPPLRARLDWLRRAVFVTSGLAVGWVLAIVLAFSPSPLYEAYASLPSRPGGLSALGDQQIAAGVMWVPGSLVYSVAFLFFLYRWLEPASAGRRPPGRRPGPAGGT